MGSAGIERGGQKPKETERERETDIKRTEFPQQLTTNATRRDDRWHIAVSEGPTTRPRGSESAVNSEKKCKNARSDGESEEFLGSGRDGFDDRGSFGADRTTYSKSSLGDEFLVPLQERERDGP